MNNSYLQICEDLRAMGIKEGDDILFQCYNAFLPKIEGGLKTLFDAIMSVLGDSGTLLISTSTYLNVNPDAPIAQPIFDVRTTPSCIDILHNKFLAYPGVERSLHPTHSVAALGARQKEYLSEHIKDSTPAGNNSPYRKIFENGCKILLHSSCRCACEAWHAIYEYAKTSDYLSETPRRYIIIDKDGNKIEKSYYYHYLWQRGNCLQASKFQSLFPETYNLLGCKFNLIDAAKAFTSINNIIQKNPYAFFVKTPLSTQLSFETMNSPMLSDSDNKTFEFPLADHIKNYIAMNYNKEFKIQEISDYFGISLYYMIHQFKKITGMSPINYKNLCKLNNAIKHLVDTNKSITEIAEECGYYSSSYFSAQFKREMKISPIEYRRIMRVACYKDHELFKGTCDKDVIFYSLLPHIRFRSDSLNLQKLEHLPSAETTILSDNDTNISYSSPSVMLFEKQLFAVWTKIENNTTKLQIIRSSDNCRTKTHIHFKYLSQKSIRASVFGMDDKNLYLFLSVVETGGTELFETFVYQKTTDSFIRIASEKINFTPSSNITILPNGKFMISGYCINDTKGHGTPAILISDSITNGWKLKKITENDRLDNSERQIMPDCSPLICNSKIYMLSRSVVRQIPMLYTSEDNGEVWSGAFSYDIPISEEKHSAGTLSDGRNFILGSLSPTKKTLALFVSNPESINFDKGFILHSPDFETVNCGQWKHNSTYISENKLYVISVLSQPDNNKNQIAITVINTNNI